MYNEHQITPEELLKLNVAFEDKQAISLSDMAENYSSSDGFFPTYLTDEAHVADKSVFSTAKSQVVASMLLQSLAKSGYVVVKKSAGLGVVKQVSTSDYDPRKNPLHEPGDYNTRQ
jgi:hypothetical protein